MLLPWRLRKVIFVLHIPPGMNVLICQPSKRQRTDLLARFTRAVLYVLAKTQGLRCIILAEINP